MYDKQVGGTHYINMPIQPWQIIDLLGLGFYEGSALKYLLRRKGKRQRRIEDLRKAIHCIEHLIELEEKKGVQK